MKQRKYFDIFAACGRKNVPDNNFPYKADTLLEDMKYFRVHGAAVVANEAIDFSYVYGNELICKLIEKNKRLIGIGVVPNNVLMEVDDPDYLNKLFSRGIKALTVYPEIMRCSISPENMKQIADALIEHKLPLILSGCNQAERYEQAARLADAYPDLNIILIGSHWSVNRYLFKLLENHKNIYYEISNNQANDLLELTKKHFGIDRVLYCGGWPNKTIGALKSLIEYADLTEEEKDLVAYGNACRLLQINPDDLELYLDEECEFDSFAKEIDAGKPLSYQVIDAHTHMVFKDETCVSSMMMLNCDYDSMVAKMDRNGTDTIITSPWVGLTIDGRKANADVLVAAQKYPGRILAYSTYNIHYKDDADNWKKYHTEYPDIFVGEKPYWPYQKFDLTIDTCDEWFSYANEHRLLMLVHTDSTWKIQEQVGELSLKYPDITFVLAHSGTNYIVADKNIELAKSRENVVLEITFTSVTRNMIEYLVSEVGADKVLYGSDAPMRDPAPQLGWVCYSRKSEEDKKKILSGNIKRLLDRRI